VLARIGLVAALAACDRGGEGGATDGPALFHTWCATCHGEHGQPSATMIARLNVRDLTASEFRAKVTTALVVKQVRAGSQNKLMPAFAGALTDAQIDAVAAYVASDAFAK
jgi:mono/diheme cytochrome c family protein